MRPTALLSVVSIVAMATVRWSPASAHTMYEHMYDSFNYDMSPGNPYGVNNWPRTFSNACGGRHQSPIDVVTSRVLYGQPIDCPRMVYRNNVVSGKLKNNGHAAAFELHHPGDVELHNIPNRDGTYYLHDFHMHCGGHTHFAAPLPGFQMRGPRFMSKGSEHSIDGRRYDGELHFVFYNSKYLDEGDTEADDKRDGIVVIAVLVEKLPRWMPADSRETAMLSHFLDQELPMVYAPKTNLTTWLDMSMFFHLPCDFYTYAGSLTTPRCHEVVQWLLLKDPLRVTDGAWTKLAGLETEFAYHGTFGNCRPVQPINDRIVESNFLPNEGTAFSSSAGHFGANIHAPFMLSRYPRYGGPRRVPVPPTVPRDMLLPPTSQIYPYMSSRTYMGYAGKHAVPTISKYFPPRLHPALPITVDYIEW